MRDFLHFTGNISCLRLWDCMYALKSNSGVLQRSALDALVFMHKWYLEGISGDITFLADTKHYGQMMNIMKSDRIKQMSEWMVFIQAVCHFRWKQIELKSTPRLKQSGRGNPAHIAVKWLPWTSYSGTLAGFPSILFLKKFQPWNCAVWILAFERLVHIYKILL